MDANKIVRQGLLQESGRGRSYRLPPGTANRLALSRARFRARGHGEEGAWNRGTYGGDVPLCEAINVGTRYARICPRAEAQANQRQPLLHAISMAQGASRVLTRSL